MFDIQKFADEEVKEYGSVLDGATETVEEELEPIPEELEGIPEDVARDIMAKAAEQNKAETASETKVEETETSVPYQRFKNVIDQKNELEQQIAAYRERYGDISNSQSQEPAQNQIQFNEQVIKQLEDAISQRAMQISGLSKEDVENIDYLEDNDPRINLWNHAKELSKASVYNEVISNHIAQQQELQRMQALQNQSVNAYNEYFAQKQATSNFDAVKQYATGEFFNAQSPVDKEVITDSFSRLSQGRVTPADMLILRDFFARAESAYAARNAQVIPNQPVQNAVNFPRTNQLQGTTGNGGGITQAQLAEMLQTRKWSEIPPKYQKMLLGI